MENRNQEQFQLRFVLLSTAFLAIQIVLISLLSLVISNFSQVDKIINSPEQGLTAKITNISEAIPKDYPKWSRTVEWALFNTILENSESQTVSKDATSASIRDGTIRAQSFEKYNINYVRMIVDVPELSESYEIFLEYPNDDNAVEMIEYDNPEVATPYSILCVEKSEIIYTDFDCQGSSDRSARQEIVSRVLGYFEFDNFSVSFRDGDFSIIYISAINNEVNDMMMRSYTQEVMNAIDSLGISPEIFDYQILNNSDRKE